MTNEVPFGDIDLGVVLAAAQEDLRIYKANLMAAIADLRQTDMAKRSANHVTVLTQYEKANLHLLDVVLRLEKRGEITRGGSGELDGEAAKREIFGRLARIQERS